MNWTLVFCALNEDFSYILRMLSVNKYFIIDSQIDKSAKSIGNRFLVLSFSKGDGAGMWPLDQSNFLYLTYFEAVFPSDCDFNHVLWTKKTRLRFYEWACRKRDYRIYIAVFAAIWHASGSHGRYCQEYECFQENHIPVVSYKKWLDKQLSGMLFETGGKYFSAYQNRLSRYAGVPLESLRGIYRQPVQGKRPFLGRCVSVFGV